MGRILVRQAARILDCHENTIRNLERKGKLLAQRDYRGYRVFDHDQVIALKRKRELLKNAAGENDRLDTFLSEASK